MTNNNNLINEAVFEQMIYGVDWGTAYFWEKLLESEGLGIIPTKKIITEE